MAYPRRTVINPTNIQGLNQTCTWYPTHDSTSQLAALLSEDDETLRITINERRDDGVYTEQASITLNRTGGLELIKVLSGLI
jgi:hypothetical protein